jgi:integrase/recombinase XerD
VGKSVTFQRGVYDRHFGGVVTRRSASAWVPDLVAAAGPRATDAYIEFFTAIRMLYNFLVIRQLVPVNPTTSVRGPKYVVKRGKTPVWSREDTKKLLESIPRDDLAGLRDGALISTMLFARISAVLSLKRQDFYYEGLRRWLRFHEKGGKEREIPAHHEIEETIDEYLYL